jgi:hypothetical protein
MTSEDHDSPPGAASRRQFLYRGSLVLAFSAGGALLSLTPAQARARALPFELLKAPEVAALETVAEALVPGAREAGISHFLDHQLAAAPGDSLLMLKYLGIPPAGHLGFYRGALDNLDVQSQRLFDAPAQARQLATAMAADNIPGWQGAPASLFFFTLRSDCVDVVYGTAAGFAAIDMPHRPHLPAPAPW